MPEEMEGASEIYSDFEDLIPGENPLSDAGKWGSYSVRPPLMVHDEGGAIHGTVEFAVNGSVYLAQAFRGNVLEAYGCSPGSGLGAALESHRIVALIGDPDAYNGYSSGYGGGIGQEYFFRRYDAFSFTGIGSGPPHNIGPEKLGIRITPTRVEQWSYHSGAWELIQYANDTTHRGTVYFALETEEQGGIEEVGWVCFGAGIPRRTQFFRWTRGYREPGEG